MRVSRHMSRSSRMLVRALPPVADSRLHVGATRLACDPFPFAASLVVIGAPRAPRYIVDERPSIIDLRRQSGRPLAAHGLQPLAHHPPRDDARIRPRRRGARVELV